MNEKRKENGKAKGWLALCVGCLALLITSIGMLSHYYMDSAKQEKAYERLAEMIQADTATAPTATLPLEEKNKEKNKDVQEVQQEDLSKKYGKLLERNIDLVGWIHIEGTKINYPVVQSVDRPNFYLKHSFDQGYSGYGCPFVAENCDVEAPSDNVIIYGHHMNGGSMFAALDQYKKRSFWKAHPIISFDALLSRSTYEIIAAFKTEVYTNDKGAFPFYRFVQARDASEFRDYIQACKSRSFYDTGVDAKPGDHLLTLSTCEYSQKNGRVVVVAKQIS